jgi:hypothetical protein
MPVPKTTAQIGAWLNATAESPVEPLPDPLTENPCFKIVQTTDGWQLAHAPSFHLLPVNRNASSEKFDGIADADFEQTLSQFFAADGKGYERATSQTVWKSALRWAEKMNLDGNDALQLSRAVAVGLARRRGCTPTLLDLPI